MDVLYHKTLQKLLQVYNKIVGQLNPNLQIFFLYHTQIKKGTKTFVKRK